MCQPTSTTASEAVVGVAVQVPEPWGSEVRQRRLSYGDTRAGTTPTHITLLPPTPLPLDDVDAFREHLHRVAERHAPFTVVLRGTGTFRPVSDVVYLQVAQGVSSCERLQADVRSGPVARELAYPYHPHVTLCHDVRATELDRAFTELADFTCTFTADTFKLYVHDGDEVWRVLEEISLG